MTMLKILLFLGSIHIAIMSKISNLAMAANYTVGAPNGGWDHATNLTAWPSSISFISGDNLLFEYTLNHDVTEVTQSDFDSCNPNNPLQPPLGGGSTVITLSDSGSRYFICGTGGHCLAGMKLQIDTLAASAPPPAASSTVLPPSPTTTAPSAPSHSPAPSSGRRPVSSAPQQRGMVPSRSPSSSQPPMGAARGPTSPPATAPPPGDSLLPLPAAPSSAATFCDKGALIACSSFVVAMMLNF